MQDVTSTKRLNVEDGIRSLDVSSGTRTMSVLEITVSKSRVLLSKTAGTAQEDLTVISRVEHIESIIGMMSFAPNMSKFLTHGPASVVQWDVHNLALDVTKTRINLALDESRLKVRDGCQDVVFLSFLGVQRYLEVIKSRAQELATQSRTMFQLRMRWLLGYKGIGPTRNILSAIQPSFFVQVGKPLSLREDLSWKFIFHLRDCALDDDWDVGLKGSSDQSNQLARNDLLPTIQRRQTSWVADNDRVELMDIPVLQMFLDNREKVQDTSDRPLKAIETISLKCTKLSMMSQEGNGGNDTPQNTFDIADILVTLTILDRSLLIPVISLSPYSMTARKFPADAGIVGESNLLSILRLEVGTVDCMIFPSIIKTLHRFVHAWKEITPPTTPAQTANKKNNEATWLEHSLKGVVTLELHISLRNAILQAAAENVVFELSAKTLESSLYIMASRPNFIAPKELDLSISHTSTSRNLAIRAKARASAHSDVLAAIVSSGGSASVIFQHHAQSDPVARCVLHAVQFEINVPRSAIRLYYFIEQWRQDYLPGLGEMFQALATEFRKDTSHKTNIDGRSAAPLQLQLNTSASTVSVSLQIMHGTWLFWQIIDTVAYAKITSPARKETHVYGLQLKRQRISVASTSSPMSDSSPQSSGPKVSLEMTLPTMGVSGSYNKSDIDLRVLVKTLRVNIKPAHWDALLSVQQKFGSDFNDLLLIISESRRKRPINRAAQGLKRDIKSSSLNVLAKFEGFKISMESPSSVQFLECHDIDASLCTFGHGQWEVTLADLSAYLVSKATFKTRSKPGRHSVLITADIRASDRTIEKEPSQTHRFLKFAVTKLHAVMQPSSINELGSFIDHVQVSSHNSVMCSC